MPRFRLAFPLALLLAACTSATSNDPPPLQPTVATVPETYVSAPREGEELDSLAVWRNDEGRPWVIASGKSSHRLTVFDGDTGDALRTIGARGRAAGRFERPNGLAVSGDLLFVVERDNHRVQALRLPGFEPAGMFGDDILRSPYGIWLHERGAGNVDAYVTDSFMYGQRHDVVPPLAELSQRVRRFRLDTSASTIVSKAAGSFGDTTAEAALKRVESLAGDPDHDRLLVADEGFVPKQRSTLREYAMDGRYTGRSLPEGSFDAEAEGVVLWACAGGGGYWIAVDQLSPLTRFHLFNRFDLQPAGTWQGETTAFTDGIAIDTRPSTVFPGGALFAVHQDRSLAAFDLRQVARTLRLDPACGP